MAVPFEPGECARAGNEAAAAVRSPADSAGGREGAGAACDGGNTGDARTVIGDRGSRATVDAGGGADHGDGIGYRDLHVVDIGNPVVGAVGGKRHAEAAVIDIIGGPGGAPQVIVGAVCGCSVGCRPFRGSCSLITANQCTALHQADHAVADIVAGCLTAFVTPDRHLDAVDGGIGRNGKAVVGAFQVMRSGTTQRDRCISVVSGGDIAGVYPDAGPGSTHIRAGSSVGYRCGCGGRGWQGGEGNILAVGCADRVGGIGPDVIRLTQRQTGDVAGEGPGDRGRTLLGLGRQRHGRIGVDIPDHTVLGRIGHAQADDRAVAHGCRLGDVRDRLGGDRGQNQCSECDIIAVGCAARHSWRRRAHDRACQGSAR